MYEELYVKEKLDNLLTALERLVEEPGVASNVADAVLSQIDGSRLRQEQVVARLREYPVLGEPEGFGDGDEPIYEYPP